jgi:glycosyltransferase involved in cell wall biosynthesis
MRIALMGTRGIPANYGGFETFYENLAPRLVERGHQVWVYNRPHAVGHRELKTYRGVHLVHLPSIATKHLDTITHTAFSVVHALRKRYDIVYICGVGNASLAWIPRLTTARVVLNVDSSDWRRAKWGRVAAIYLRTMERLAGKAANLVIVDNQAIGLRYRSDHGIEAVFVPYGANVVRNESCQALQEWGLEAGKYLLWVGRLEPETRVEELIEAFGRAALPGFKLAIVGDAPFADAYKKQLRAVASSDVVFTGRQFGEAYQQLSCHAFAYVQTSPTSGTSPALLDQMAFGNAVIARGTETNSEDDALVARLGLAAIERVRAEYSWEHITDVYTGLFGDLVKRKRRGKGI